ncbi:mevalonate kinase, partial [Maniola jurtina]|uniref:mevalonate kinase n=1 Tax=Maniola jurtina TaxID=191418 RepID=UPI001E68D865
SVNERVKTLISCIEYGVHGNVPERQAHQGIGRRSRRGGGRERRLGRQVRGAHRVRQVPGQAAAAEAQAGERGAARGAEVHPRVHAAHADGGAVAGAARVSGAARCRAAAASAPGKVILHGEHSVMFGRTALAGSLGLRTTLTIQEEEAAEPVLRLQFPAVDLEESIPLRCVVEHLFVGARSARSWAAPRAVQHESLLAAVDGFVTAFVASADAWSGAQRNAVRGFLYLLAGVLGDEAPAHTVCVRATSALAVGAGAGSSAAFAVCAAAALLALRAGAAVEALGADERALISAWAFNCERIMHGAPSGIDNWTCTFGGLVSFRKGSAARPLQLAARLRVLLVDTRVSRQTGQLAARVAALRARHPRAADCVIDACGHVADDAAQLLQQLPGDAAGDAADDAVGDTDSQYRHLAELWDMNHCLLAALGVSHAALEDIRRRAAAHRLAAKLTGAGGGGNAIVLIPPSTAEDAVRALSDELRSAGYGVTDTLLGGEGVTLHRA